jgi:hypothetical protein
MKDPSEPIRPLPVPPPIPSQPLPQEPLTGTSVGTAGVTGQSNESFGIMGQSMGPAGSIGSAGYVAVSDGVYGIGKNGVHGLSYQGQSNAQGLGSSGVLGENVNSGIGGLGGNGVSGTSNNGHGVYGQTSGDGISDPQTLSQFSGACGVHLSNGPGVLGFATGTGFGVVAVSGKGTGLFAEGTAGAARFAGDVTVLGNITSNDLMLAGGDCAEQFDSAEAEVLEPGTVVVIGEDGRLCACRDSYDRRVAGVVSGAGDFRPAIVMDGRPSTAGRTVVAMVGKVYCKVDASVSSIRIGDLLTPASTPGHAMKASDSSRAFGAVIGKALGRLDSGCALIPILVALQ